MARPASLDHKGEFAIAPRFERGSDFHDGLAAVALACKYGYIDVAGQLAIPPQYELADDFHEGLAAVKVSGEGAGRWGYVDRKGQPAIPARFELAGRFSGGMAAVMTVGPGGHRWGFIDRSGEFAVPARFCGASTCAEDLASVQVIADSPGQVLKAALAPGSDAAGTWGFAGRNGTLVIAPQFRESSRFSQGLAAVRSGDMWGYIDKSGRWVIPPKYDEARAFCEGLALVGTRSASGRLTYGYVNTAGRHVLGSQTGIVAASHFSEGLASLTIAKTWYERLNPLN